MASNNLVSQRDVSVINDLGIATAGLNLCLVVVMIFIVGYRSINHWSIVKSNFGAVSSRILYVALFLSISNSASFIVICTNLASNHKYCNVAMWFFLVTTHVMSGLCGAILLHCALLLECKNLRVSTLLVRLSIAFVALGSLALGTAGLLSGRFGYHTGINTCWIIPPANHTSRYAFYKMEAILLYGPLFGTLLLSFIALACVWYHLSTLRKTVDLDLSKAKSLIFRVCFPPAVMLFHCLMIIGGDLPITYHTRAGQFTSYLFKRIGFGSLGLALGLCAVFIDPALRNMIRLQEATVESRKRSDVGPPGDVEEIQVQVSQKPATLPTDETSLDTPPDDMKQFMESASDEVLSPTNSMVSQSTDTESLHKDEDAVDPGGRRPSIRTGSVVKWPSDLSRRVSDSHVCTPDGDCCIFIV